ncbi:hypothetical protein BJV82DRAFT_676142 [Fennellomyces sp. T-0311]|nr:hypothetical protein BJV82DRAFT_676142 [Fennellomyces sp. T-0311]
MELTFFYYEAGKHYYCLTPTDTDAIMSDPATENESNSSGAMSQDDVPKYVWTLRTSVGYTPTCIAKFTNAIKYNRATVNQASKDYRLSSGLAYRYNISSVELLHAQKLFLADYVERYGPRIILKEVVDALAQGNLDQQVTNNAIQSYLKQNFTFNIHIADEPLVSESEKEIVDAAHKEYVSALLGNKIDYSKCIFFDECKLSRTDLLIAKTRPKKQKNTAIPLQSFVCMSANGALALSQDAIPTPNTKKLPNLERQGSAQGTRVDHFQHFVNGVIQILKEQQQANLYFVFEDLPDHKDQKVIEAIKKAKHRVIPIPAKSSLTGQR